MLYFATNIFDFTHTRTHAHPILELWGDSPHPISNSLTVCVCVCVCVRARANYLQQSLDYIETNSKLSDDILDLQSRSVRDYLKWGFSQYFGK